jgi:hypothetical protein
MFLSFIQVAFICIIPVLIGLRFTDTKRVRVYQQLIVVSNLLLIGYSIFLIRQLIGLYQLSSLLPLEHRSGLENIDLSMIRLCVIIVLPFFTILQKVRENLVFSVFMVVMLYWQSPLQNWNLDMLWIKIPAYISLFSTAYALLWLFHKMPDSIRD